MVNLFFIVLIFSFLSATLKTIEETAQNTKKGVLKVVKIVKPFCTITGMITMLIVQAYI